ncbi:MAG: hypothetical protein AMJ81_00400 [Phycisphaerae bacterium SM23_33]|jgi:flagellar motor switch protein FliN/FliY|nr:MAG: hypothetical protein AMJ81_00400 [Phycisphaerae bacterium SM23_33]
MAKAKTANEPAEAPAQAAGAVEVQEAELPEASGAGAAAGSGQIDILLDTTLSVEVQLGQVQTQVRELLQLGSGSVLTLDKQVGEPVELFLRGTRFATGQLVVVGDRLGVKIREITSPRAAGEAAAAGE